MRDGGKPGDDDDHDERASAWRKFHAWLKAESHGKAECVVYKRTWKRRKEMHCSKSSFTEVEQRFHSCYYRMYNINFDGRHLGQS